MPKKLIEHPFHKISFDYDDTKQWTSRDEKLLNLYINLHDTEAQRHQQAISLKKSYSDINTQTETLRTELKGIKEKLNATRENADHILAELNLGKRQVMDDFTEQINQISSSILQYDKKIRVIEKEIKKAGKMKNKYHDAEEDDRLWEQLMELKITYAHDSRLSTDYVSFDRDEERFREKTSFMSRENDKCLDSCNLVIDNFNRLMLETETQYEVWKEFGKRLLLIEHIASSGFGTLQAN